jgi:uncharacterized protein
MAAPTIENQRVEDDLWDQGYARLGVMLSGAECDALRLLYFTQSLFRSTIDMQRYRFGRGEYRYFNYPLPKRVQAVREHLYEVLSPAAGRWMDALGTPQTFPRTLAKFLEHCHANGQCRPTPLLLHYGPGDFNCLHQDVYGAIVFPFQVIVGLSAPGQDYGGGELLLVEQRPRSQSVGHALLPEKGEAIAITTRCRPVRGIRGFYRASLRHGVSRLTWGERFSLGLIFHDAS